MVLINYKSVMLECFKRIISEDTLFNLQVYVQLLPGPRRLYWCIDSDKVTLHNLVFALFLGLHLTRQSTYIALNIPAKLLLRIRVRFYFLIRALWILVPLVEADSPLPYFYLNLFRIAKSEILDLLVIREEVKFVIMTHPYFTFKFN